MCAFVTNMMRVDGLALRVLPEKALGHFHLTQNYIVANNNGENTEARGLRFV